MKEKNQSQLFKDEVRFQVEAAEMANGIEPKTFEHVRPPRAPRYADLGKMRNFHTVIGNGTRNRRSLCQSPDHGVWFCKQFHDKGVDDRWQFAKERKLLLTIGGKIAGKPVYVE